MNYANMIEERRLKQGFILATLISTIAGTFTTGINLYDRIIEKRKQSRLDKGQDQKIQDLERRVNEADGRRPNNRDPRQKRIESDDLRNSLQYSGPAVQEEYDRHYAQLGAQFAEGDMTAKLQLQSQIITLQGTVIKLLEEALVTGNPPDISKLYNASEFAREGSVRALRDQYHRMLEGAPARRPPGPIRRISSTSALDTRSDWSQPPPKALLTFDKAGPLFCPCAEELQKSRRHLRDILADPLTCPSCGARFSSAIDDRNGSWKIEKEAAVHREYDRDAGEKIEVVDIRTFALTGRFIVKCHREQGGYACYLCYQHRDSDTLCQSVESLVRHVASAKHQMWEYERDPDIKERKRSSPSRK